jgi:ribosomal-protein-alanine N-acetyltransferase
MRYLARHRKAANIGYLLRLKETGELAGVINLSEIVHGVFQSAYLGFYAHAAHAGRGLMREGLERAITLAFGEHGLHRLEANIQPANAPSRNLVKVLGFRLEGLSPKYLKIGGRWRDHERWGLTKEEWSPTAR